MIKRPVSQPLLIVRFFLQLIKEFVKLVRQDLLGMELTVCLTLQIVKRSKLLFVWSAILGMCKLTQQINPVLCVET